MQHRGEGPARTVAVLHRVQHLRDTALAPEGIVAANGQRGEHGGRVGAERHHAARVNGHLRGSARVELPHRRLAVTRQARVVLHGIEREVPARHHVDEQELPRADGIWRGLRGIAGQTEDQRPAAKPPQHFGSAHLLTQAQALFLRLDLDDIIGVELPVAPFAHHVERGNLDDLAHQARAAIGRVDVLLGERDRHTIGRRCARIAAGACAGDGVFKTVEKLRHGAHAGLGMLTAV